MTIKIDIDKYSGNSPLIRQMLHMADQGKFGEKENGNGMIDTEKETDRFLKLAKKNEKLLEKQGYKVTGESGIFIITKTNPEYDSNDYYSVLFYDKKHDYIQEEVRADGITLKTHFFSNNLIKPYLYNSKSKEKLAEINDGVIYPHLTLTLYNILTLGGGNKRIDAINKLSNIWQK